MSQNQGEASRMPLPLKIGLGLGGICLLFLVLLGSPYEEKRSYSPMGDFARTGSLTVRLELAEGRVEIVPGEEFRITAEARGHGFPTSKVGRNYLENELKDGAAIIYTERISGWLKELDARLRIEVPWDRMRRLKIDTGAAEVSLMLGDTGTRPVVEVVAGSGSVVIDEAGASVVGVAGDPRVSSSETGAGTPSEGASYRLEVGEGFRGTIRLEDSKGQ